MVPLLGAGQRRLHRNVLGGRVTLWSRPVPLTVYNGLGILTLDVRARVRYNSPMTRSGLHTTPERSALMGRVRQRDTGAELEVRRTLHGLGARFRTNVKNLPGSPDIANKTKRKAILVHGCYWHYHEGCSRGRVPKRNSAFWRGKLERNRQRDRENVRALSHLGYDILVVWECDLMDVERLTCRLSEFWFE